jgi:hypothetical protein
MRTVTWVLIVAALVGWGCARPDWIERTLVTVDVTGIWSGTLRGPGGTGGVFPGGTLWFELEQQASTVKGTMRYVGSAHPELPSMSRPIDGTVTGDVFRFRQRDGNMEGELTVSGDEMTGQVLIGVGPRALSLRRVDPSSRPPR